MATNFNYVKKGYDPEEVDTYIENLKKIIRSYEEKDASIKNAIINAQVAADNIVLNAKNESSSIRTTALRQVDNIIASISSQRDMLSAFEREYTELAEKYLYRIKESDLALVHDKINALERYLMQVADKRIDERFDSPIKKPVVDISEDSDRDQLIGKADIDIEENDNSNPNSYTVANPLNSPTL